MTAGATPPHPCHIAPQVSPPDDPPQAGAKLAGITWSCKASRGSSCSASGSGDLRARVDLRPGGTATFVATGMASEDAANPITSLVTVAHPAPDQDPAVWNNTSTQLVELVR